MEEILKELMNTRCVAMHNPTIRCYGKGCTGECAQFQVALDSIRVKNIEWLTTHTYNVNDSGVCLEFSEFKEAKKSIAEL